MVKKIKVLVVDDSLVFRKTLIDNLSKYSSIEVVGYAVDAYDAMSKIPMLKPNVITLDVEMPKLNGIEFLKQLIPKNPIPVILVSSLNLNVFDALSAGAIDFVKKPDMEKNSSISNFITELYTKITIASNSKVRIPSTARPATAPIPPNRHRQMPRNSSSNISPVLPLPKLKNSPRLNSIVIAIGASTGGTEATLTVLRDLPPDTPGIVVVQHMPIGFTKMYADRLNHICHMEVKEAKNGDRIQRGRILIAPGELQMKVVKIGSSYTVSCLPGEKVSGHRPSVDVLFNSVAEAVKKDAVGIIMTGMGRDGADGLLHMRKNGAFTIGQNKESCVVYGMPMVAYNIGAVGIQASCENIAGVMQRYLNTL